MAFHEWSWLQDVSEEFGHLVVFGVAAVGPRVGPVQIHPFGETGRLYVSVLAAGRQEHKSPVGRVAELGSRLLNYVHHHT